MLSNFGVNTSSNSVRAIWDLNKICETTLIRNLQICLKGWKLCLCRKNITWRHVSLCVEICPVSLIAPLYFQLDNQSSSSNIQLYTEGSSIMSTVICILSLKRLNAMKHTFVFILYKFKYKYKRRVEKQEIIVIFILHSNPCYSILIMVFTAEAISIEYNLYVL